MQITVRACTNQAVPRKLPCGIEPKDKHAWLVSNYEKVVKLQQFERFNKLGSRGAWLGLLWAQVFRQVRYHTKPWNLFSAACHRRKAAALLNIRTKVFYRYWNSWCCQNLLCNLILLVLGVNSQVHLDLDPFPWTFPTGNEPKAPRSGPLLMLAVLKCFRQERIYEGSTWIFFSR